jgi:hypothetical protein
VEEETIFTKEQETIDKGSKVLEDEAFLDNPMKETFSELLTAYKRLFRQTSRLVKISDRQQNELRELNELKNKFLGIAAHDLRNPLGVIQGFSQLMLEYDELERSEIKDFSQTINRSAKEMLKLLNDLLDISVIESGKLDLQLVTGNLTELVKQRILLITHIAGKKDIKIISELEELPEIIFDSSRLSQVIDNLLTNASKFSQLGASIFVTLKSEDDMAQFSVRDQGQGIPPGDLNKLFGVFQKLSTRPTGGEKSTGLGLSIVKKIVDAHKGKIEVDSEVGKGTTFTVFLPRASRSS